MNVRGGRDQAAIGERRGHRCAVVLVNGLGIRIFAGTLRSGV